MKPSPDRPARAEVDLAFPSAKALQPRYQQLRQLLRQRLVDGVYDAAYSMPGERELAKEFGVGRVTVRAALARLEQEGLVMRLRGKGTLPSGSGRRPADVSLRGGLLDELVSLSQRTRVRVLSCRHVQATPAVARSLGLEHDPTTLEIVRVRSYKRRPISHTTCHVPRELARGITRGELGDRALLDLLHDRGIGIATLEQTMGAALADTGVATALDVPAGTALLKVTRVAIDGKGRPVQHLVGLFHPERYEYRMRLSGVGGETRVWVDSDQQG